MDIAMETSTENTSESKYPVDEECNIVELGLEEEIRNQESIEQVSNETVDVNDAHLSEEAQKSGYEIPSIGKKFNSDVEAHDFYNLYARKVGFSIRKRRIEKTRDGIVRKRTFTCSKEGYRQVDSRVHNVRKSRPITRTGCKAQITVKLTKDGIWMVTNIVWEHNHSLAPKSSAFLLGSQRLVEPTHSIKISTLNNSGISPTEGYHLRIKRTTEPQKGDIQAVLEYLEDKHLEDPMFFHSVQVDQEDKMTNFFWVDSRSVQDYIFFGDVVCFDATYKTNMCGRPFAPFVGVNHHNQIVFFGAALLLDETTESFIWLFQTFLKAMSGRAPKSIITDQCAAIGKAIAIVMPETRHRLCLCHIYINTAKSLSNAYTDNFKQRFKNVIYAPEIEEEFVLAWDRLLKDFNLEGNKWLEDLFKIREKWALVYGREFFCANMTTTQRSESTHSFLKRYLKSNHDRLQFLQQYERAVEQSRLNELSDDFNSNQSFPILLFDVAMLEEAAKEYTRTMYAIFEEEYKRWVACDCDICEEVGSTCVYKVTEEKRSSVRSVTFDSSNNTVVCSCKKFEFMGIQCRHVIKVLFERKIRTLPPQYILKRWTKSAKFGILNDNDEGLIEDNGKAITGSRYSNLCHQSVRLALKAANSEKATLEMAKCLREFNKKLEEILKEEARSKPKTGALVHGDLMSQPVSGIQEKCDGGPGGRIVGTFGNKRKKKSQSSQETQAKKGKEGQNSQNLEGHKQASIQEKSQSNSMPCQLPSSGPMPISEDSRSFTPQLMSYGSPLLYGSAFQFHQGTLRDPSRTPITMQAVSMGTQKFSANQIEQVEVNGSDVATSSLAFTLI